MHLCTFIITDGGSNQEESYYFGKPCFIMREHTERQEGIGHNVVLGGRDLAKLEQFVRHYATYKKPPITSEKSPSAIIGHYVEQMSQFLV
jgi:UDP-N-acetylglucosamine 2-epimerase (non-hydrolysing)